jgi:hypothetical protein
MVEEGDGADDCLAANSVLACRQSGIPDEVIKVWTRSRDSIDGNHLFLLGIERDVLVVCVVVLGRATTAIGNQQSLFGLGLVCSINFQTMVARQVQFVPRIAELGQGLEVVSSFAELTSLEWFFQKTRTPYPWFSG